MDKSNEKDRARNRYAKLQPLVNRINKLQDVDLASNSFNYHHVGRFDDRSSDSYAHQLRNDFGNLLQAASRKTEVMKNPMDVEFQNSKMPVTLFDQSVLSPATNAVRTQKKHKNRIKQKLYSTSLLDLKTELLDILNCIVYILWSPIVFFARLFLTLASSSASMLYDMLKLSSPRDKTSIQKVDALQSAEKKPKVTNSLLVNSHGDKQASNLSNFLTKRIFDFNPGSGFVSQGVTNGVTIGQLQTLKAKNQKKLQSLRKKFNLSLEMVNEIRGKLELEGENYFRFSSHYRDISSVESSSNCLLDEYTSRIFNHENGRKTTARLYHDSFPIAGRKMFDSALRNSSLKGSRTVFNSKQLLLDSKNSCPKSKPKFQSMKNLDMHLSGANEISDKQVQRIDPKNQSYRTDKHIDSKPELVDWDASVPGADEKFDLYKQSSAALLTKCRKKTCKKSEPHAFAHLPLRPSVQKKSSSEDKEKSDCSSSKDLKNNLATPDLQNSNLQPIVEPSYQLTKKLESYVNTDKDLLQKKEFQYTAAVLVGLNESNARKLVSKCDAETSNLQCKLDLGTLKNETTTSKSLKDVFGLDEYEKKMELSQPKEICGSFEEDRRTNGSGDRLKVSKNATSKTAEFTKPIDAKSKWLEMKRKFYGKDYTTAKEQPEKLETQNLSQITSVSKLPVHKIFQYNMQVGRARQMGTEPPLAEDIFLERKTTSPCIKGLDDGAPGYNPRRNETQFLKSAVLTSRCLSQTQSLSQWPIDLGNSHKVKKYYLREPKPKPKARTEGGFNRDRIEGDAKTPTVSHDTAQFPHRPSIHANSSVSSSNLKDDQVVSLDWPSENTSIFSTKNENSSDEYTEKINSLIFLCQDSFSVPRESIDRNFKQAHYAGQKILYEVAAGKSS